MRRAGIRQLISASLAVVRALAALAQAVRLRIFRCLVVGGRPGLTPSALADELRVAATTLLFYLKELMHAVEDARQRLGWRFTPTIRPH